MKRQTSLMKLQVWVVRRLHRLRPHAEIAPLLGPEQRCHLLTFLAIDLHNTCAAFLRGYYLSSATRSYMSDGSKTNASVSFPTQREALTFAIHHVKRAKGTGPWARKAEIPWHSEAIFLRVLGAAGCSTLPGAAAAWSIETSALEHLTSARNYFAHRNNDTAETLRHLSQGYKVEMPDRPDALLVMAAAGRPQPILSDWLDDLEAVFTLMPA